MFDASLEFGCWGLDVGVWSSPFTVSLCVHPSVLPVNWSISGSTLTPRPLFATVDKHIHSLLRWRLCRNGLLSPARTLRDSCCSASTPHLLPCLPRRNHALTLQWRRGARLLPFPYSSGRIQG